MLSNRIENVGEQKNTLHNTRSAFINHTPFPVPAKKTAAERAKIKARRKQKSR